MQSLNKVLFTFIPKNTRCRFEEQKNEAKRESEKKHIMAQVEKIENPASVELSFDWEPMQPDMSVCSACKEVVYSNPFKLVIKFQGEVINTKRPVVMCEACLNMQR